MIDYDPHKWRTFFNTRGTMLGVVSWRAGAVLVLAVLASCVHHYWYPVDIPETAHALIGPALSLLLVFRTNSSYDRFWEGRKIWGTIMNTSRNMARLASVYFAAQAPLRERVLRLLIAFPYAAMNELRGTPSLSPMDKGLTDTSELLSATHIPTRVVQQISAALLGAQRDGLITDVQQCAIDRHAEVLIDCIGACERIHKTPLPFAYVVHLRRAMVAYCATLPFALLHKFGWGAVAASFFVAIILFGIEEIGVEIEDPFGTDANDLPLEDICGSIERNVRAYL